MPHPAFEHGVVYPKHAEVSLEEMDLDNVVITDVPTGALLHGSVPTSVGRSKSLITRSRGSRVVST